MLALYIIAAILTLIGILLLSHVKLVIRSDGKLDLRVRLGLLSFRLSHPRKKPKIKLRDFTQKKYLEKLRLLEAEKNKKAPDESEKKKPKDKGSITEIVDLILEILSKAETYTGRLKTEIRRLNVTVGGRDPAQCAITYGVLAQTASYLIELLDTKTKLKKLKLNSVNITCDFLSEKTVFDVDLSVKITVFDALITAIDLLMIKLRHDAKNINIQNTNMKPESEELSNG